LPESLSGTVKSLTENATAELDKTARDLKATFQVPIGTIVDWYRFDSSIAIPDGYQICDGTKVTDSRSRFNGKNVPDLTDKFVMGVPPDRLGETGGRAKLDPAGAIEQDFPTGNAFGHPDGSDTMVNLTIDKRHPK
jgi:hypothetical protein